MKSLWACAWAMCLILAVQAHADVYSSALQKAHNIANENNARQGITGQPTPPPPAPAPQPDPVLAATLKNIGDLQADLAQLETDPGRKQPLINDLNTAASGHRPSNETINKLAQDLASLLSGKALPAEQLRKMAQSLRALFNSSHLSTTQQNTLLSDMQKSFQTSGAISTDDPRLKSLDADLRVVIAATK